MTELDTTLAAPGAYDGAGPPAVEPLWDGDPGTLRADRARQGTVRLRGAALGDLARARG